MYEEIDATTPTELLSAIEDCEDVTVLDVRQPHEFERDHIESDCADVVNRPLRHLQALDPRDVLDDVDTDHVVTVCNSGNRSAVATRLLNRSGIEAKNLQYGMQGWNQVAR
ncbi:MAG: rhodanese-like domain-containing protein [Haloarculaceae archaeon]